MERAGRLIARLKHARRHFSPEDLARAAWPAAVGEKAARHSKALSLHDGVLTVEAEDGLWGRNLELLAGQILRNLSGMLGGAAPRRIQFRTGIPRRPVRSEEASAAFPPAGQDAAENGEGIGDPVLQQLYLRSRRKAQAS